MISLIKPTPDQLMKAQLDVTAPNAVQIQLDMKRGVVWVNVDGICLLRCCRVTQIELDGFRAEGECHGETDCTN